MENKVLDNELKKRFYFESSMARLERIITKLWIVIIILIVALIGTNAAWIYYENSFEDIVVTQEATADGDNDIRLQNVGGDFYGSDSEANSENTTEESP